ncbi:MAG: hypothetical protein M1823_001295 [Watsoniomyces obsoletus]|nr:MAG: hypothetical protein M1823_001295 [Watsoniomyces obsoletus]
MSDSRRSVLITGCAPGGIGHSLAKEFHNRGFRVFATARNKDVLADLHELGMETLSLDVTSQSDVEVVKNTVEHRTGGRLDYLVNNAGRSML